MNFRRDLGTRAGWGNISLRTLLTPFLQTRLDVSNRVPNQSTKHCRNPNCTIISFKPKRLLIPLIPNRHQEHKARIDSTLKSSKQKAIDSHPGEICARRRAYEYDAPADNGCRDETARGETLEEIAEGELED